NAFGVNWLRWWEQGRPNTYEGMVYKHEESKYLKRWKEIVHEAPVNSDLLPAGCTVVQRLGRFSPCLSQYPQVTSWTMLPSGSLEMKTWFGVDPTLFSVVR
ncbi:MAG: hypothetical protein ACKPFA_14225, partial [Dolichospermum sp.]